MVLPARWQTPQAQVASLAVDGDGIRAEISPDPWFLSILDAEGQELLAEPPKSAAKWAGLSYSRGLNLNLFLQPLESLFSLDVDLASYHLTKVVDVESTPGGLRLRVQTSERRHKRFAVVTITSPGPRRIRVQMELTDLLGGVYRLRASFRARLDEHFTGFGERFGTTFDQQGRSFVLGADRCYAGPEVGGLC
jgi:hypothetical protein